MNNPRFLYSQNEIEESKIKYILSIGKRQPMHIGHKKSLEKILNIKNTKIIYVIGSVNKGGDPLFDPFVNPLNVDQQIEQFKRVFPNKKAIFIPIPDVEEMSQWGPIIINALKEKNIDPKECAIHFIGKPEDRLKDPSSFFLPNGKKIILESGRWLIEALAYYDIAIQFDQEIEVDLTLSARNLRNIDLESKETSLLAAPKYLLEIASEAKDKNSQEPITLRDLSLQRIKIETSN